MTILKCGTSKKDITPSNDVGDTYIAGYFAFMAPKIKEVHDPIFARSMVLSDRDTKIALVSVECIGLMADFVDKVRDRLSAYDFKERQIYVWATHTHSAPDTMGLWGPLLGINGINKKYQFFLIESIVQAVVEAEQNLEEVELYLAESKVEKLIENYRIADDINGTLQILKFTSKDKLIGSLWTYSAQPEITTRENVAVSGDYPGAVCDMIEKEYGGISLFGLGLCGSQSPIYCEQGYEKMELFAKEVFSEIRDIFPKAMKLDDTPIEIRHRRIDIELENPEYQLLFRMGMFERELVGENIMKTTISKIKIGSFHIVHIPGEPFPGLFTKILDNNSDEKIMFISLSNDSIGYFVPLDQYRLKPQQWVDNIENGKFTGHENESVGLEAAEITRKTVKDLFVYKIVMAIGTHADDLSIWAGGTLKRLSTEGNKVICVRITDDYADCVGITKEQGIKRNRKETEISYRRLGAEKIIHLDYPTDTLVGVDYLELRGKLMYLIRKYKPDIVISFDYIAQEENMDHIITGRAVNEACWQSPVELFYPEHLDEGLEIHAVGERYLFGGESSLDNPSPLNFHVDIGDFIEYKIRAIADHRTVMKNWFYQRKLTARANRLYIELFEEDIPNAILINVFYKVLGTDIGKKYGVKYAEEFNRIGAGVFEQFAED